MSLCQLMQMAYKGANPEHIGFDEYDLRFGIDYADGYIEAGYATDLIGGFDLADFAKWCKKQLETTNGD